MSSPQPTYRGANGEVSAVLRRAGQPYDLEMGKGGTQVHYLATAAATKGGFGLYRWEFTGPPSRPALPQDHLPVLLRTVGDWAPLLRPGLDMRQRPRLPCP